MSVKRKKYELSAGPMLRILTQLRKSYPDAMSLEVKLCEEDWLTLVSK